MTHRQKIELITSYLDQRGMTKVDLIKAIGSISLQYGKNSLSPSLKRSTPIWVDVLVYMIQNEKK